jgi:hypothetical protein
MVRTYVAVALVAAVALVWLPIVFGLSGAYFTVALVAAAAALLLRRLIGYRSMKRLIDACICLLVGAGFFWIFAVEVEHSPLVFGTGLTCLIVIVFALLIASTDPRTGGQS